MIQEGQQSFRSQIAYVNLVAVLVITAVIIVVWDSQVAAMVFAALGVVWTGVTLRSGIDVTDDGFKVRGMLRTRRLSWSEVDAFVVVGFSGSARRMLATAVDYAAPTPAPGGTEVLGLVVAEIEAEATTDATTAPVPLFSVVAAVTRAGERVRVHGTASTPLDPAFPAEAAAELNRRLQRHNSASAATAATVTTAATAATTPTAPAAVAE